MGRNAFITCDKCLTKVRKDELAKHKKKRCDTNMKMVETKMGKITKCGRFTAMSHAARHVKKCGECQDETKPEESALTQHSDIDTRGGGSMRNPMEKYDWQTSTQDDFITQNDREIIIIYDNEGNKGKSFLAEKIEDEHPGTLVWCPEPSEMKYGGPINALYNRCKTESKKLDKKNALLGLEKEEYIVRNVIVDLPRSFLDTRELDGKIAQKVTARAKNKQDWKNETVITFVKQIMGVLEKLKNGRTIESTRLINGTYFNVARPVNVMIMTNSPMVLDIAKIKLSKDRIHYKDISCASSGKYREIVRHASKGKRDKDNE